MIRTKVVARISICPQPADHASTLRWPYNSNAARVHSDSIPKLPSIKRVARSLGILHSTMDSSAASGLLRLYVPHGAPCDGRGQEILKQHATGSYSASCATAHVGVPCSATRSVVTEHGQIGICWEQSEQSPIPAVLAQLQTDARFHAVQVYFCSPCWHRADVIVPAQPGCTAPRQSSDDTTSILTIVPSQLRSSQSYGPSWTHHPICMYIIAGFCFSGPSTSLPTHEWFSMTLQTIRRRYSGYNALSSTKCDVIRASLLWQAFGTGALSYAAAWWLVAWLPLQSPLDTDQIEVMFQQGHDWLSWCGILLLLNQREIKQIHDLHNSARYINFMP